ncbi:hypothetical protein [Streptomyces rimosus]|uniref:hypothetical protein n=1 Tax=Streptomyces rimosus TaxID=1927 RepID=UPI0004CA63E1|nr:hypothetical protein [Streptomyces rimosus]
MTTQAMPHARRPERTALRTALAVAVTGTAIALPTSTAFAAPGGGHVKEVKAQSGETLKLDGKSGSVSVQDPEHGFTGVLNHDKPGPVQSRMDPNGTYTLVFPKPAAQADAATKVVYKHDGKTTQTFDLPKGSAADGR